MSSALRASRPRKPRKAKEAKEGNRGPRKPRKPRKPKEGQGSFLQILKGLIKNIDTKPIASFRASATVFSELAMCTSTRSTACAVMPGLRVLWRASSFLFIFLGVPLKGIKAYF